MLGYIESVIIMKPKFAYTLVAAVVAWRQRSLRTQRQFFKQHRELLLAHPVSIIENGVLHKG
jgi:uncharacterized membrane protein YcaP (DUF421 family)